MASIKKEHRAQDPNCTPPKIFVCRTPEVYSLLRLHLTELFNQSIIKGSKICPLLSAFKNAEKSAPIFPFHLPLLRSFNLLLKY